MTNTQLLLSICIPSLVVLASWLQNASAVRSLSTEVGSLRQEVNSLRQDVRGDIRILTDQTYQHGREIESLKPRA